jgi:glyoxylase-like metal-dependent hydrolase (beta-lactamase superfamily II)
MSPDGLVTAADLPSGLVVFERGWLSSNNVLFEDDEGATLVDSGYLTHAEQTLALAERALATHAAPTLARVVNTHLHSDHCGGNALLALRTGCAIVVPAGNADAVRAWDAGALSFEATGQTCDRFDWTDTVAAGDLLTLGGSTWQALSAPGHDSDALMFHDPAHGVLITGDALWRDGCGAMFPTADPATIDADFAAAFATFDLIEALSPRIVIPGHGAPFSDVCAALERTRGRLRRLADDRGRNAHHVAKVLLKYRLLDERRLARATVRAMFDATPTLQHARREVAQSVDAWAERAMADLVRVGAARRDGDWLVDA